MNHKALVVIDIQNDITKHYRDIIMTKAGYTVHVVSDCVTSYDLKKMPEMLSYYAEKGCEVKTLAEYMESN